MTYTNYILLFVDSPDHSGRFYESLLGVHPVESSPTFCLFALPGGVMLGLWSKHTAEPSPSGSPGSAEFGIAVEDGSLVDALFEQWVALGVTTIQAPTELDFGRTFVALDPDGHRIRVFCISTL